MQKPSVKIFKHWSKDFCLWRLEHFEIPSRIMRRIRVRLQLTRRGRLRLCNSATLQLLILNQRQLMYCKNRGTRSLFSITIFSFPRFFEKDLFKHRNISQVFRQKFFSSFFYNFLYGTYRYLFNIHLSPKPESGEDSLVGSLLLLSPLSLFFFFMKPVI